MLWTGLPSNRITTRSNMSQHVLRTSVQQRFFGLPYVNMPRASYAGHLADGDLVVVSVQAAAVADGVHGHLVTNLDVQIIQNSDAAVFDVVSAHVAQTFRLLDFTWGGWAAAPHFGRFNRQMLTGPSAGLNAAAREAFFGPEYINVIHYASGTHLADGNLDIPVGFYAVIQDAVHQHLADNLLFQVGINDASHGHLSDALLVESIYAAVVQSAEHGHIVVEIAFPTGLAAGERWRGGKGFLAGIMYPYRSDV
jgi:hypothetical protein